MRRNLPLIRLSMELRVKIKINDTYFYHKRELPLEIEDTIVPDDLLLLEDTAAAWHLNACLNQVEPSGSLIKSLIIDDVTFIPGGRMILPSLSRTATALIAGS